QKAFGWWNGPGWVGWQNAVGRMGFRPVELFAALSTGAELVGGLLLVAGLLTPLAAAMLIAESTVIIVKAHVPNGFWNRESGVEFPLLLGVGALAVALIGPGAISLDNLGGLGATDQVRVVLAIAGLLAGALTLALPPAAPTSTDRSRSQTRSR